MLAKHITPRNDLVYLLGNVDSKKQERPSEIVGGSFLPVVIAARKDAAKFKEPSFVYVYRDPKSLNELGGKEFEEYLQECILDTFFPGLDRKQFNYLFIRHHNKDNSYELNFYCVCMANGKQFTPYLDWRDRKAHEYMGRMLHCQNKELIDPFSDMSFRLLTTKSKSQKTKVFATEVNKILDDGIANKTINNRNDFLDKLESKGYAICRKGLEYFTAKKNDTKVRFYGRAAEQSFNVNDIAKIQNSASEKKDWATLWQTENQKRNRKLIDKYKHLKELNYEDRRLKQYKYVTHVRSNVSGNPHISRDEIRSTSRDESRITQRDNEASDRMQRTSSELESDPNGQSRENDRRESSGEDGLSLEENIGEFDKEIGCIFERFERNAEKVVRTTAAANSRAFAKIRILCNAVTKVAVALYHKLKGIPRRSKGGDGYGR